MLDRETVVLVVEDEPVLRMNVVDLVEDAGFVAVEAANATQALGVLESRSDIGIILSDIDMPPGIDGTALAAIVHDRWPPIAIILVSGHAAAEDVRIPGGGEFFSKPYRGADIVDALNRLAA
ncbi:response regulator [Rhodopseudomonas sp. NSM]|uniref:response regulator n=1 Tax=Rhodopseudomonas sp. NSM TaxID=3457630 RepID=UPI004035DC0D